MAKTVYVTDKKRNIKVRHGYFEGLSFYRYLDHWRGVRWSDRSFSINIEIFNLKSNREALKYIKFYKFIVTDSHGGEIEYRIRKQDAENCETVINEYGEENIRIPIENCEAKVLREGEIILDNKTEKNKDEL